MQYRFRLIAPAETRFKFKWQIGTVYEGSKEPQYSAVMSEIIQGNGATNYGNIHTEMPSMDRTSTNFVVFLEAEDVTDESNGGGDKRCRTCPGGGFPVGGKTGQTGGFFMATGQPGGGIPDLQSGGPGLGLSMGSGLLGDSSGEINFSASQGVANLANPSLLTFLNPTELSDAIYTTNGVLIQVKAAQGLAEVVVTNAQLYAINFYSPDNVGGKTNNVYFRQGNPYVSWVFQNPDGNANNRLDIYEVRGASIITNQFTWNTNYWEALLGNSLTKKRVTTSFNGGTQTSTVVSETFDPTTSTLVAKYTQKFQVQGSRLRLIEEQNGGDPATTYTYDGEGFLTETRRSDGSWEYRDIFPGSQGLVSYTISGYQNNSFSYNPGINRYTEYDYQSYHADDDLSVNPRIPRRKIEEWLGSTVGRRYTMLRPNVREDRVVQNTVGDESDAYNLITIRTNYSSGMFEGYPLSISHENGTLDVFYYYTNSTSYVTIQLSGEPNATNPKTNIVNGTKTVTTFGLVGELISEVETDLASGITLSSKTCNDFDAFRRPLRVYYLDGTFEGFGYGCCNVDTKTNRDGTITYYSYDALKRLQSTTDQGIALINVYDAADRLLKNIRQGTDSSQMDLFKRGYNVEGRLTAETNALGGVTLFSQGYNGSGELVQTNETVSTGAQVITRTAKDGSLQEISGSGANRTKYYYGVESTGDSSPDGPTVAFYTKEVKVSLAGGENEWTKTYTDMVGRSYRTIFAAASGAPTRRSYFNAKGQLIKQTEADGVQRLFQYDGHGHLEYDVVDMDQDGVIDWSGTDRITQTQHDVLNDGTFGNIVRERKYVWDTLNSNTSVLASTLASSTDGLTQWKLTWNGASSITHKTQVTYPTTGTRRVTETMPNNATRVTDSIAGRVQSVTDKNSGGSQVFKTSYAYDEHGRPETVTDARNGATTQTFNNADQVVSVTTPAPGTGQPAQTTINSIDELGRIWRVTHSDGTYTTTDYTIKNEVKRVAGAKTYPTGYGYDGHGRMTTMTNWQDFAGGSGTSVTTWTYDQYRGWLLDKDYGATQGPIYTYNNAGRLATRLWSRGITTTYTYENSGALWKIAYSDGTTAGVTNTYDRLGRLWTVAHNGTTTTMGYNGAGLLLSESHSGGTLDGRTIDLAYDSSLRRSSVQVNGYSATVNSYTYDTANRLATVGDGTYSATYTYLANSRLVSQILYKNAGVTKMTTAKQYDFLNRLEWINSTPSGANTAPFYYGYIYNDANQRTRMTTADGSHWAYGYDSLGQLTTGKKYWSDGVPVEALQNEYVFDDIGNRKSTKEGGDQFGQNLRSANYTNNALNQITGRGVPGYANIIGSSTAPNTVTVNGSNADYRRGSFYREELAISNSSTNPVWTAVTVSADTSKNGNILTPPAGQTFWYDADGNLTNDLVRRYIWDGENRLVEIQPLTNAPAASKKWLTFSYDWQGRRISKTAKWWTNSSWTTRTSNKFVYDGWNLIGELNATNNNLIRGYIWGADLSGSLQGAGGVGGLIACNDASEGSHFNAFDGNGNVMGTGKATDGSVTASYEFDPFGQTIKATGGFASANPVRFSTKYFDSELDVYCYGRRYYSPSSGRWLSRDPIEESGGLNVYAFVENDGINRFDALGLRSYGGRLDFGEGCISGARWRIAAAFESACKRILSQNFKNCMGCGAGADVLGGLRSLCTGGRITINCEPCSYCGQASRKNGSIKICNSAFGGECGYSLDCTIAHEMLHLLGPVHKEWDKLFTRYHKCLGCPSYP